MFKPVSPNVDFLQSEKRILEDWKKFRILEKYLKKNQNSKKKFSFVDGPITANNPMGVHHAWGRTYKDLWQRFFNMRGFRQRFQNGFDEQGLWIEVEVEKELGLKSKKDIENLVKGSLFQSIAKFVNLCKERVEKFSSVQTQQSRRLGYFMDWDNSYHTSSDKNNYAIWHYLKSIHEKGWLYKGRDSVPWCPRCGTAISQHEILTEEYKEVVHKSVFVKYPVLNQDFSLLVWTTTPWTIPGNVSVAVDPKKEYVTTTENLIVLKGAAKKLGLKAKNSIKGKKLIGLTYTGPFDDLPLVKEAIGKTEHKVIGADELVTEEEGTGLVHIAPGAGEEDFKLSKEQKLPVIELIDEEANYIDGLGEFSERNAKKHPELIIDYLKSFENGKFFYKDENYKHRYPTCWRCKTELVWRVVNEWYIAMDLRDSNDNKTYREKMKQVIKEINWIPKWGYERELDWLNNMRDWLISKKRYWGLALPIWECDSCGNFAVMGSKEELKRKAVAGWEDFEGNSPHRPWIDKVKVKCSKCGKVISRIIDVGNVWLDAGVVPYSTLDYFDNKSYWQEWFPADFITESFSGQFKNWFYSLIAISTGLENTAPFKSLLGHGMVRDEKGEEMHKSKGNAIEFNEAAEKIGVDVMRWLYLRTSPEHNVNFGYHIADDIRRFFHLRLWNVYSFFVIYANIDKWTPSDKKFQPTTVLDKWIFSRMHGSIKNITEALERYDAADAVGNAETFVVNDLSNWYVRRIRDRVSPATTDEKSKNDVYQTLWSVLSTYTKVLAPMIPFITEEIYKNLTGKESIHLEDWPEAADKFIDNALEEQMTQVRELAEIGHSLRKEHKIKVRQPLISFTYGKKFKKMPEELETILAEELNVKQVVFDEKIDFSANWRKSLDITLTQDLEKEGRVRDLIREIQQKRKEAKVDFSDTVKVKLPSWPKEFEDLIKRETLARELTKAEELSIEKVD